MTSKPPVTVIGLGLRGRAPDHRVEPAARQGRPAREGRHHDGGRVDAALSSADRRRRLSGDDSTIDTHVAAMGHLVEESESLGVGTELPRLIKTLTDRAVADGHGGESYAAMIEYFRKPQERTRDRIQF